MINIVAQEEILEATEKDFHVKYLFVLVDMNQFSEELKGLKKSRCLKIYADLLCIQLLHRLKQAFQT